MLPKVTTEISDGKANPAVPASPVPSKNSMSVRGNERMIAFLRGVCVDLSGT